MSNTKNAYRNIDGNYNGKLKSEGIPLYSAAVEILFQFFYVFPGDIAQDQIFLFDISDLHRLVSFFITVISERNRDIVSAVQLIAYYPGT